MDTNDLQRKSGGEVPVQLYDRKNQCWTSSADTVECGDKLNFTSRAPAQYNLNLPPKPNQSPKISHSPPPVPEHAIKSSYSLLFEDISTLPSGVAPPKPPRMKRGSLEGESFNAYENDDRMLSEIVFKPVSPPALQQQTSLLEGGVRMRQTRGWYEDTDGEGNNVYFHPDSTDQWVKTESEDGKIYYYERLSRRSAWELPPMEPRSATNTVLKPATCTVNERLLSAPLSSIVPSNINTIDLSEAQAKFGARKKSGDNSTSHTQQDDSSSGSSRASKVYISGPIENKLRGTERRGQVNFTRCSGNRSNKKSIPSILLISGPTLFIYKESRNQLGQKGSNVSGKPEVEVHVRNIEVLPVSGSDNSFMLVDTTDADNVGEYLIETPSAELRKAWETAVKYSKDFDKEDRFERRILSTRPPPSVDQRVIAMLREFFRRRPTLEKVRELGILKDEPVFGSNLIELCRREETKVPTFVTRVIRAIEYRGLETPGLYRKSGNVSAIQKFRNQVNHCDHHLNFDNWDVYELADSLKLFLRELKEPLLVYALYDDFESFQKSLSSTSTEQNILTMRRILDKMPESHYATSKVIYGHLSKVAAMSSVNQMNSRNLALVFGPNVVWRDIPCDDYSLFSIVGCSCSEFLITHYTAVFASPDK